jgi:hypothetical protein
MTKQEIEIVKARAIEALATSPNKVEVEDSHKTVTRHDRKWKFECKSDTESFYVESIFDAVDWLYEDLIADDEEEKWKLRFTTRVEPKIVRDILESLSEYSEILTGMSDTAWNLYRENGNEIHLGENNAYAAGADLFYQMRENLEKELKEKGN